MLKAFYYMKRTLVVPRYLQKIKRISNLCKKKDKFDAVNIYLKKLKNEFLKKITWHYILNQYR